jgi:hypothetical protein
MVCTPLAARGGSRRGLQQQVEARGSGRAADELAFHRAAVAMAMFEGASSVPSSDAVQAGHLDRRWWWRGGPRAPMRTMNALIGTGSVIVARRTMGWLVGAVVCSISAVFACSPRWRCGWPPSPDRGGDQKSGPARPAGDAEVVVAGDGPHRSQGLRRRRLPTAGPRSRRRAWRLRSLMRPADVNHGVDSRRQTPLHRPWQPSEAISRTP